jgi:hypothetical protein
MFDLDVAMGRLIPYWISVLTTLFVLSFLYAWTNDPGYLAFEKAIFKPVRNLSQLMPAVLPYSSHCSC